MRAALARQRAAVARERLARDRASVHQRHRVRRHAAAPSGLPLRSSVTAAIERPRERAHDEPPGGVRATGVARRSSRLEPGLGVDVGAEAAHVDDARLLARLLGREAEQVALERRATRRAHRAAAAREQLR